MPKRESAPSGQTPFFEMGSQVIFLKHEMISDVYASGKKPARAALFFEEAVGHYSEALVFVAK